MNTCITVIIRNAQKNQIADNSFPTMKAAEAYAKQMFAKTIHTHYADFELHTPKGKLKVWSRDRTLKTWTRQDYLKNR
jgi:hypothetical protein